MAYQLESRGSNRYAFVPRVGPLQGSLYQRPPFWLPDFLPDEGDEPSHFKALPSAQTSPPQWLKQDLPIASPLPLDPPSPATLPCEPQFPSQPRSSIPLWEVLSQEESVQSSSNMTWAPNIQPTLRLFSPNSSASCVPTTKPQYADSQESIYVNNDNCGRVVSTANLDGCGINPFDQFKFRDRNDNVNPQAYSTHAQSRVTADPAQNISQNQATHLTNFPPHPSNNKKMPHSQQDSSCKPSGQSDDRWAQFLDPTPQQRYVNFNTHHHPNINQTSSNESHTREGPLDAQPLKLQPLRLHPLPVLGGGEKFQGDPLLRPDFDKEVPSNPSTKKPRKNSAKVGDESAKERKRKPSSKPKAKDKDVPTASTTAPPSTQTNSSAVDLDLTLGRTSSDINSKAQEKLKASLMSPTKRYKQTTLGSMGSAVTPEKAVPSPSTTPKNRKLKSPGAKKKSTPKSDKGSKNSDETSEEVSTKKKTGSVGPDGQPVKRNRKKSKKTSEKAGVKLTDLIDELIEDTNHSEEKTANASAGSSASRYDLFSSQRAFSRHCLEFFEQNCKDIRNYLELFRQVTRGADRVVMALFWDDGSTSYRPTSAEQRKAVRNFRKNEPPPMVIDSFSVDRSERDPLALIFRFGSGDQFVLNLSTEMMENEQTAVMDLFRSDSLDKIAFDAKNTLWALLCHCRSLPCYPIPRLMDPQIGAWICDPDNQAQTNFEVPGLFVQYPSPRYVKSAVAQFTLPQLLEDVNNTGLLAELLKARLDQDNLWDSFADQEMQMVPLLALLQFNGIAFDRGLFTSRRHVLALQVASLEQQACAAVGKQFLLTSPEQVAKILFEDLKLPLENSANRGRSGATNNRHHSTGNEILAKLSPLHPLPGLLLQHRALSKKLSTYMDPMIRASCPDRQRPSGGYRIYSQWHQVLTGTGRLSSSKPNLQSLPRGSKRPAAPAKLTFATLLDPAAASLDEGFDDMVNIREAFVVSDPNKVLLSADFSQMEMRILALLSKDPSLQTFFNQAQGDIYNLLASACFKLAPDQVKSSDRDKAKAVSLGIIYGMGPQSTAEQLTRHNPDHPMTVDEAKLLIATWHKTFPMVRVFINKTVAQARQKGYVCTLSNRRRYLPNIKSIQAVKRSYAERQSVNTVIQGSAADIMKRGMARLFAALRALPDATELVLQLHDEVVLEVALPALQQVQELVRQSLEEVVSGSAIRFPVNIKSGKSLGTLSSI